MKKTIYILLILFSLNSFSQNFIPFGEDSIYRASGWYSDIYTIYPDYPNLYIGGYGVEYAFNNILLNQVARWNGSGWEKMDNGLGGYGDIYVIEKYQNQIYIGGNFNDIDDISNTENIGRFNGTTWEALPNTIGELSSYVFDMLVWDNKLIIGGGVQQ